MEHFKGKTLVLATMHGKEKIVGPLLTEALGVTVVVPEHFNTDRFGTFTRDIIRTGTQLDAARAKAVAAMEHTGADLAVASEGTFGPDPALPFVSTNHELVVLIDRTNGLEVRGTYRSPYTNFAGQYVTSITEALDFARRVGFPTHALILRKSEHSTKPIYKGIVTEVELREKIQKLLGFFRKKVWLETDMRAHMNPTRMNTIAKATENLLENIRSRCPTCGAPGFVVTNVTRGLPCNTCGLPTEAVMADVRTCTTCRHTQTTPRERSVVDPAECSHCNP